MIAKAQGRRIAREKATISAMLRIWCRDRHGGQAGLCPECEGLREYAHQRLDVCPFGEEKPACNHCQVHCYSALMREQVKAVMRHAGPRMLFRHPVLSLWHMIDKRRPAPALAPRSGRGRGG